jgi:tRNA-2-methylthio-N6-dimethylallyladenosine synthase
MATYDVRTHGCQMNVHDSERLSGLLEQAGYSPAAQGEDADVVVLNTCAVRENADNKLYGNLGQLAPAKRRRPGMQIAVGGCLAQKDRGEIVRRAPWVDVVFGTHNIGSLPALLDRARHNAARAGRDPRVARGLPVDPADQARVGVRRLGVDQRGLQQHLHVLHRASLRGTEKDRRPGDVLAEVRALVADGAIEVTLLGPERQHLRRRVRRPARVRQAACGPAARSTGSSGCASPARTRLPSPTT